RRARRSRCRGRTRAAADGPACPRPSAACMAETLERQPMTSPAATTLAAEPVGADNLDALESEAIHIFREVAGEFDRPVILFSGGKDSTLLLHLAIKAFWPAPVPFA